MTESQTSDQAFGLEPGGKGTRLATFAVRVGVALVWIQGAGWKTPPNFGEDTGSGLYRYTHYAVTHEVFAPWTWFVRELVLPNFAAFGWLVLLSEAALGAFLLLGLATRFWALVGVVQASAIMLTVSNAPSEFGGTYWLLIVANLAVFALAAGRVGGIDGVLRPVWARSSGRAAHILRRVS
jgi:thiosulfate dehydrogenase [quinone] large subunit